MRALLFNADDFGLTPGVTDGILQAHLEGLLRSTSLLVNAPDAPRAAALARQSPGLGVGIHLALTAVRPVLSPSRVPSLVQANGHFPYSFLPVSLALSLGRIRLTEVEAELEAQINRALQLGVTPTHVDGHNHLHVHPKVLPIVLRLMARHRIPALRLPGSAPFRLPGTRASSLHQAAKGLLLRAGMWGARNRIRQASVQTPDHFWGFEYSGHLNLSRILQALPLLPEGVTEVMMHPARLDETLSLHHAWGYAWEEELQALLSLELREALHQHQIPVIHFGQLRSGPSVPPPASISGD